MPQYEFETTLEVSRNNEFIDHVSELARISGFNDPIVSQLPGFGTSNLQMENEVFLVVFSNAGERMEHRTDALCQIVSCEVSEGAEYTTYSAAFYCNLVDCDLEQLRLAAEKFRSGIEGEYIVTTLEKRQYDDPVQER